MGRKLGFESDLVGRVQLKFKQKVPFCHQDVKGLYLEQVWNPSQFQNLYSWGSFNPTMVLLPPAFAWLHCGQPAPPPPRTLRDGFNIFCLHAWHLQARSLFGEPRVWRPFRQQLVCCQTQFLPTSFSLAIGDGKRIMKTPHQVLVVFQVCLECFLFSFFPSMYEFNFSSFVHCTTTKSSHLLCPPTKLFTPRQKKRFGGFLWPQYF